MGNAVKFTEVGQVTIRAIGGPEQTNAEGERTQTLRFEVRDTGVGMTAEEARVVFEPFIQVGDKKRRSEGTGLGLAITQQLVQLMGGKIWVESEKGGGSTFRFNITVPIVSIEEDRTEQGKNLILNDPQIIGYKGPRRKVLIVDDRQTNRLVLRNLLESLGFDTEEADNGRKALEKVRQYKPSLLLTDSMMPEMNGPEMVKAIRAIPDLKDIAIIAISASNFKEDKEYSHNLGYDGFLPKPVDTDKLLSMMGSICNVEWIYDQSDGEGAEDGLSLSDLTPPPKEELDKLFDLAQIGMMSEIKRQAERLEQLDERYRPFAEQLRHFANQFDDEKLMALIEQYV